MNNADSPKTPGGISKSLLTPCRRVGLSRKWKKSGVSPFVSPLGSANINNEIKQENEIRKRKKCNTGLDGQVISEDLSDEISIETINSSKIEINCTPTRTPLPRKKSKTLITSHKCQEIKTLPQSISELSEKKVTINKKKLQDSPLKINKCVNIITCDEDVEEESIKHVTKVSKLSKKNSKSSNKLKILESSVKNTIEPSVNDNLALYSHNNKNLESGMNELLPDSIKKKSPNNLTRECIVVIQKKIFKTDRNTDNTSKYNIKENVINNKAASQTLFDSDNDDVPLSNLNKIDNQHKTSDNALEQKTKDSVVENTQKVKETIYNIVQETRKENSNAVEQNSQYIIDLTNKESNDNDFVENMKVNTNRKLEKTKSTVGLKNKAREKSKTTKLQTKCITKPSAHSSSLCDEDDDFDYGRSRTILIKKTYDKVAKPLKAKSTGSITQKDLDDIAARIESKKNLLLAKSMTSETKELRELIKKWKVGCQTALMELLDLMKEKLPDRIMDHSELLQMLKIPPDLVGYDSDSDCFNTPDDTSIILSALKLD